jgi:hypothetical protein
VNINIKSHKSNIIDMYVDKELSLTVIGKDFGVSGATIAYWLKKFGVQLRSQANVGNKNGRYVDGKSSRLYRNLITKKECFVCKSKHKLLIHHKDGNHFNNELSNLEVLCSPCHTRIHKIEWWAANKKDSCVNGHPLSGENLYVTNKGYRGCRACRRMHVRRSDAKRKSARNQNQ